MKNILILITLMIICTGCNQGQLVPSLMYAKNLTIPNINKIDSIQNFENAYRTNRFYN